LVILDWFIVIGYVIFHRGSVRGIYQLGLCFAHSIKFNY
jgi:hypothetical protein